MERMPIRSLDAALIEKLKNAEWFRHFSKALWSEILEDLHVCRLAPGETLFKQGDPAAAVYMVVEGSLEMVASDDQGQFCIGKIRPFDMLGEIGVICGSRRSAGACAQCSSFLVEFPSDVIHRIGSRVPNFLQSISETARRRLCQDQMRRILPDLFGPLEAEQMMHLQESAEWVHLSRGDILCNECEAGDCLYVVISGRLQAVKDYGMPGQKYLNDIARGEIIGEMALLTGGERSATVIATRDSDLVKISRGVFDGFAKAHPGAMMSISQMLVRRIVKTETVKKPSVSQKNIAVVTTAGNLPIGEFSRRLTRDLSTHFPALYVNRLVLEDTVNVQNISFCRETDPDNVILSSWFEEQESIYTFIVLEADPDFPEWTKRCIRNADLVLVLAPGGAASETIDSETCMMVLDQPVFSAKKVLIFIHEKEAVHPEKSGELLDVISAQECHHVRWGRDEDMARIARFLSGKAVNLVLSGGAACGLAHIGVIRALEENGIPIDSVSGTSMGAVIASQYAMGMGYEDLVRTNRWFWVESRLARDYTLPLVSLLSGKRLEKLVRRVYGDIRIEDLWLPFFCVSTSLSRAKPFIHRKGRLWSAISATTAVPGLVPPVVLGNEVLVDGGIMNNLPVDLARDFFQGVVIGIDVTDARAIKVSPEGFPSTLETLRGRLGFGKRGENIPGIFEIIYRSALVGSRHKTEQARVEADFYLRPPMEKFKFLQFNAFDAIINTGYQYAAEKIREWMPQLKG